MGILRYFPHDLEDKKVSAVAISNQLFFYCKKVRSAMRPVDCWSNVSKQKTDRQFACRTERGAHINLLAGAGGREVR